MTAGAVSEAALRAVQHGLDPVHALAIGAARLDVAGYAQRDAAGIVALGARAEIAKRLSDHVDAVADAWLERSLTPEAQVAAGLLIGGRVSW